MTCSFQMGAFKASVQLLRFFFPIMVVMDSSVQMEISLAAPGSSAALCCRCIMDSTVNLDDSKLGMLGCNLLTTA